MGRFFKQNGMGGDPGDRCVPPPHCWAQIAAVAKWRNFFTVFCTKFFAKRNAVARNGHRLKINADFFTGCNHLWATPEAYPSTSWPRHDGCYTLKLFRTQRKLGCGRCDVNWSCILLCVVLCEWFTITHTHHYLPLYLSTCLSLYTSRLTKSLKRVFSFVVLSICMFIAVISYYYYYYLFILYVFCVLVYLMY